MPDLESATPRELMARLAELTKNPERLCEGCLLEKPDQQHLILSVGPPKSPQQYQYATRLCADCRAAVGERVAAEVRPDVIVPAQSP